MAAGRFVDSAEVGVGYRVGIVRLGIKQRHGVAGFALRIAAGGHDAEFEFLDDIGSDSFFDVAEDVIAEAPQLFLPHFVFDFHNEGVANEFLSAGFVGETLADDLSPAAYGDACGADDVAFLGTRNTCENAAGLIHGDEIDDSKARCGGAGDGGLVWIAAMGVTLAFIMEPFKKVGV